MQSLPTGGAIGFDVVIGNALREAWLSLRNRLSSDGMGAARIWARPPTVVGRLLRRADAERGDALLSGIGADGQDVFFRLRDVHSVPLLDKYGKRIGVSWDHPGEPSRRIQLWAGSENPSHDHMYYPFDTETQSFQSPAPTPWSASAPPVKLHVHASPDHFEININVASRLRPKWERITVDGTTFGRLATANTHFRRAARANPDVSLALLACESGAPDGSAQQLFARYLHNEAEIFRDVHAPSAVHKTLLDDDHAGIAVEISRDAEGKPLPAWVTIPTPRRSG